MLVDTLTDTIHITNAGRTVIIAEKHKQYVRDVVVDFDYYFNAVEVDGCVVDFSKPHYHKVRGYPTPLLMPSFVEPYAAVQQYLDFAQLQAGEVVLDLGAYSGLTSLAFAGVVGESGFVVAVEADEENARCAGANLVHSQLTQVDLLQAAVWEHNNGIMFSAEHNMGGAAVEFVGERGKVNLVRTVRLSALAVAYNLPHVDFIKCDIEGAESVIFRDADFFAEYRPRMIIEPHNIKGRSTIPDVIGDLMHYGYSVKAVTQPGVRYPLLECVP